MKNLLKRVFFDIEPTVYALTLISFFSIIGAFIIYFNPEGYNLITSKPLFEWLSLNTRFDTFWLFLIILFFGFTAVTGFFCFLKDLVKFRLFTAIFHLTFLLVLLAHLITAMYGFKIPDIIIPQSKPETIVTPPPFQPLKIFFSELDYKQTPYGVPTDIKAKIIYLEGRRELEGTLSVNNPLKVNDFYIVLRDVANYLASVELILSDGKDSMLLPLIVGQPFQKDNYRINFLANDEQFRQIKISYQEGEKKEILFLEAGSNLTLSGKTYRVNFIKPVIIPALIIDVSYDPSLMLIFYASTVFTLFITIDVLRRLFKHFSRKNQYQQETS